MSTMRIKCLDMKEVESIIADAQEILSHVEIRVFAEWCAYIILRGVSLKICS